MITLIILSLIQGITELLPVSSSAHLIILPWFFKINDPGLAFDVALHLGTLLALIVYFFKDWLNFIIIRLYGF
jgi:undecaprenyl-diphosphatase